MSICYFISDVKLKQTLSMAIFRTYTSVHAHTYIHMLAFRNINNMQSS
jgi:hypothetical protein